MYAYVSLVYVCVCVRVFLEPTKLHFCFLFALGSIELCLLFSSAEILIQKAIEQI